MLSQIISLRSKVAQLQSENARILTDGIVSDPGFVSFCKFRDVFENLFHVHLSDNMKMVLSTEKAKSSVVPEQLDNEKVPTEDASSPTSFTPHIKYQKLEFKVWDRRIKISISHSDTTLKTMSP